MTAQKRYDRFTFGDLVDVLPPLETIEADAPLREAIRKMCAKDYSQLPVMENGNCVGSVTSDSVLWELMNADKKGYTIDMSWPVKRFLDRNPPRFVRPDDDLMRHVDWMASKSFVLIGSPQKLERIITNYDLVLFFRNKSEVFLLLREIETTIRHLIRQTLPDKEFLRVMASAKEFVPTRNLSDLTFDDLRQTILANWEDFAHLFRDKNQTDEHLQIIRNMRNEVFHFRESIGEHGLQQLRRLRDNYIKMVIGFDFRLME